LTSKIRQDLFKFNTLRRMVQFLSFIFFSAAVFNLSTLPLLLPVLWTWGIENLVGDAFTALQFMFYDVVFPWLPIASFLIVGVLFGKSLCGWICPFGFIQDLVGFVKRKKMELSLRTHEFMIYIKYAILAVTLLISITLSVAKFMGIGKSYEGALGVHFAKAPFTSLSPAETLFATLPQMISSFQSETLWKPLFWVQLTILVYVLVFAAYVPRSWCKYFCPHGAVTAILNRFSFLGLRRDPVKCAKGECRLCVEACPMRVRILDLPWEKFSDPECTYCLKCIDSCPNKAIKLKYP